MKIRTGFVSNSSSSSFVAWGVDKDKIVFGDNVYLPLFVNKLAKLEKRKADPKDDWYHKYYVKEHQEMIDIQSQGTEAMVAYAKEHMEPDYYEGGFECGGEENDFVGMTVSEILKNHSDWTFNEVCERVAEELNKTFGMNFSKDDISYVEEGWYNG